MRQSLRFGVLGSLGLGTALMLATGSTVSAATATANLTVSATVTNNCTISTSALAFGAYDPIVTHASANLDGSGGVTVTCTKGAVTTIGLGLGANASASVRRLASGANYLTYEIYQETGRTTVWGTTGAALLSVAAAPSFEARSFSVFGRVAAAQDVPAGSYTDTVVATVNF